MFSSRTIKMMAGLGEIKTNLPETKQPEANTEITSKHNNIADAQFACNTNQECQDNKELETTIITQQDLEVNKGNSAEDDLQKPPELLQADQNRYEIVECEIVEPGPSGSKFPTSRVLRERNTNPMKVVSSDSEDDDDSVADPPYKQEGDMQPHHVVADFYYDNNDQINNDILNSSTGRPRKGRKRKFEEQNRALKKLNKNSNKSYYNYKGNKIEEKEFNDFVCNCPKKCSENILTEKRIQEFNRFWSLQSYNAQTNFIAASVTELTKKRTYGRNTEKRAFSRIYKLDDVVVCKNTFIKTLGITSFRVNTALKKFHGRMALTDQRGIAGGRNKLSEITVQKVIDQINKIPRYKSHYKREKTDSEFLPPGTTIQKLYEVYCSEENNPISIASYKRIFYSRFNLKMKPLKKDTCNTCDALKIQIDNEKDLEKRGELKGKHSEHLELAEGSQMLRRQDFKKAKENEEYECLTFDLEKTLPLPRIPTNIVFYKRQLWVYNAGVHSGKEERGYCYVWIEGEAGRGSQEVGSCLLKHIQHQVSPTVKHLILWSDACGGQNRNIKITLLLKSILQNSANLETITLNFLASGHSFLPNDSDFGDIESKLKSYQRLYTPNDYIEIMRTCRKKNPLIVTKMNSLDFFSVEQIEKSIVNRRDTETGDKINWLHIKSIKLQKNEPFTILVKQHNFSNAYQAVNIKKNIRGRKSTTSDVPFPALTPLWPNGKPIAEPKLKNLNEMLHLIPSDAKSFYTNLRGDKNIVEDVDGYDVEQLDFNLEID